MSGFLSLTSQHGYAIIFVTVFLEAVGLPVPAALALVAGGAAAASGVLHAPAALLLAVAGMVLTPGTNLASSKVVRPRL